MNIKGFFEGVSANVPLVIGASVFGAFGYVFSYSLALGVNVYEGMVTSDYLYLTLKFSFISVFIVLSGFFCLKIFSEIKLSFFGKRYLNLFCLSISFFVLSFFVYGIVVSSVILKAFLFRYSMLYADEEVNVAGLIFLIALIPAWCVIVRAVVFSMSGIFEELMTALFIVCLFSISSGFYIGKFDSEGIGQSGDCIVHVDDGIVLNGKFVYENSTYNFFFVNDKLLKISNQKIKFIECKRG